MIAKPPSITTYTTGIPVCNHSSYLLYFAKPLAEGPSTCKLGMENEETAAALHDIYLAIANKCNQLCNDSSTIYSISFKPFK